MSKFLPDSDSEDELPPAWEERAALDGSVYYVNHVTKGTQWTHPRTGKKKMLSGELPDGWEKRVDCEGKVQYYDKIHQRMTYTDPRLAFAKEVKEHDMDVRQRFDGSSTALQVLLGVDLSGKTYLITGSTNGIGFECARSLAMHGAEVVLMGRSEKSCTDAENRILSEKPKGKTAIAVIDLTSLDSVRHCASELRLKYRYFDGILLNAGILGSSWEETEDGFETVFQVNHLAHFYLIILLESTLRFGSRIVITSSESHRFNSISLSNISMEKLSPKSSSSYWYMMAYNNSKLCNILHGLELARRLSARGVDVMSCHPGNLVFTGLPKRSCLIKMFYILSRPFTKSLQQAAATNIYCTVAPELNGSAGQYFNNCCLTKPSEKGADPELAKALWDLSLSALKQRGLPIPPCADLM